MRDMLVLSKTEMDILEDWLNCKINNLTEIKDKNKNLITNSYYLQPKDKPEYDLKISCLSESKHVLKRICEAGVHIKNMGFLILHMTVKGIMNNPLN
jgi:hypothetical protein